MKKTLVAAGIIVALGVVWTGGAWYTGKELEKRLPDIAAQANAELARSAPGAGLQLTYQDYQRGLFSSHVRAVIKPADGAQSSWLKPDQSIVMDENISHGPFPLKKFSLIPSMAVIESTLVNNDTTKPLFAISKDSSPLELLTKISYSGDTNSDLTLHPLNYENGDNKFASSGGKFDIKADKDGNALSLNGDMDSLLIATINQYGQKVQFTLNNLKTENASRIADFKERVGSQKLTLEKLAIAVQGQELAVLDGMTVDGSIEPSKDGKTADLNIDYTLDSLKLQGNDLGSGKLTLKVGQINGEALHQFTQQYNSQVQPLLAQAESGQDVEQLNLKAQAALMNAMPLLLKGDPVITIAPLSWKNAKGETAFNLSLFLKDAAQSAAPAQTLAQEVDRNVKSLEAKLVIPMDMATEFMTQIARLEGYQQDDAVKLANQQVKGLSAMGQMFRVTTVQDDSIQSSLQYANGQVTLNGEKMPLENLVGMFAVPDMLIPATPQPQETAPGQ